MNLKIVDIIVNDGMNRNAECKDIELLDADFK